jgi:hypothetical protein
MFYYYRAVVKPVMDVSTEKGWEIREQLSHSERLKKDFTRFS